MAPYDGPMQSVMAFYLFAVWPGFSVHQPTLREFCRSEGISGSILLAPEGINGNVAGPRDSLDRLLARLRDIPELADLSVKYSAADHRPFRRMRVRLKREIVPLGVAGVNMTKTGTYVEPTDWDALISDPEVVVIDTRNRYEVAIGSFPGAINPKTNSFRDFPAWVASNPDLRSKPKVAMYCTGGIRCEKASAFLREQGFEEVYQLQGGILGYLEEMPPSENLWEGECYVFDGRVSVGQGLVPGDYEVCPNCNAAVGPEQRSMEGFEPGVACPDCASSIDPDRRRRFSERQHQIELARRRGDKHLGQDFGHGGN